MVWLPSAMSAYTASKSAVNALTHILAKELRGRDITATANGSPLSGG